jgi:hypothetical protein
LGVRTYGVQPSRPTMVASRLELSRNRLRKRRATSGGRGQGGGRQGLCARLVTTARALVVRFRSKLSDLEYWGRFEFWYGRAAVAIDLVCTVTPPSGNIR